jgi:DNA-binding transcriptional LysR family regulator
MKLDQLKSFHRVALTGSFTEAARDLFLTQPAVSQQIQLLEHAMGVRLFDRPGKKTRLTSEGEILLSYTIRLFQLYEEIEMLFSQLHGLEKGKVTIGSTAVLGTYILPRIIGRFSKKYPGIEIDLRMGNSQMVHNWLLEGSVDLGFAGKMKNHRRLKRIRIHREMLLMVCSKDNPLAQKKSVRVDDLGNTPFIWREKGTQTRSLVKEWFEKNTSKKFPQKSIELQNLEAAKRTVIEGYGVTVTPEIAARREIHLGLLRPIHLNDFSLWFEYYLLFLKGKIFSKASRAFIEMLANFKLLSQAENLKKLLNDPAPK